MLRIEDAVGTIRGVDRQIIYLFPCSVCGNEIRSLKYKLTTHSGKCRVCCVRGKPYEHIHNELKTTKQEVTITYDEFLGLIDNGPKCHYCECALHFNPHTRDDNRKYVSRAYQLDRKDNALGYSLDNVVTCCWECNRMKSDKYSYEEFMLLKEGLMNIRFSREKINNE